MKINPAHFLFNLRNGNLFRLDIRLNFMFIFILLVIFPVKLNAQWKFLNVSGNYVFFRSVYFTDSLNGWGAGKYLFKTTDGGYSWVEKTIPDYPEDAQIFGISKKIMWVTNSFQSSLRTTDGGETWNVFPMDTSLVLNQLSFFDNSIGYAIGEKNKDYNRRVILKTTDGGENWNESFSLPVGKSAFCINCVSEKSAYVGGSGLIVKTTDGGESWQSIFSDSLFLEFSATTCHFISDTVGLFSGAFYAKSASDSFYTITTIKTTNGGKNWKYFQTGKFNSFSFTDKDNGYGCGAEGLIAKTTDFGETWMNLKPPTSAYFIAAVAFAPNKALFFGKAEDNNPNVILKTTDSGNSWSNCDTGRLYKLFYIRFLDGMTGYGSGNSGNIYKTTNGGVSWILLRSGLPGEALQGSFWVDILTGWYLSQLPDGRNTLVLKTVDGGYSWENIATLPSSVYSICFTNKLTGFICGGKGAIYKTTDGGKSWKFVQTSFGNINFKKIVFADEKNGWAAGDRDIIARTTDGGNSWFQSLNATGRNYDIVFADSLMGWAIGYYNDFDIPFVRTTDGGNNWIRFRAPLQDPLFQMVFPSKKTGYAIAYNNVLFKTSDGGENWRRVKFPIKSNFNSISFIDDLTGWVSTQDGYILKTTIGAEEYVVNVAEDEINSPNDFYLCQNFPNPFNPVTTIKYSIPHECKVNITVYNSLGQKVRDLVDEIKQGGIYQATFDGNGLTSGVYLYRLNAGVFSQTKKLILLK